MKKWLSLTALCFSVLITPAFAASWSSDLGSAQTRAYAENRFVLINFTGSDWCPWCIRLQDEVFSKPEFHAFADTYLMLVEIDFPNRKFQAPAVKQANKALADKYFVQGYPTIILLNSKGDKVGQMGYLQGGPQNYINAIQNITGINKGKGEPNTPAGPGPGLFNGAPTGPPPKYKQLSLKSITGAGPRKLALINNNTFGVGESGKVRLGDGEVKIRCEEIRDKSVIITMDGSPARSELRLK